MKFLAIGVGVLIWFAAAIITGLARPATPIGAISLLVGSYVATTIVLMLAGLVRDLWFKSASKARSTNWLAIAMAVWVTGAFVVRQELDTGSYAVIAVQWLAVAVWWGVSRKSAYEFRDNGQADISVSADHSRLARSLRSDNWKANMNWAGLRERLEKLGPWARLWVALTLVWAVLISAVAYRERPGVIPTTRYLTEGPTQAKVAQAAIDAAASAQADAIASEAAEATAAAEAATRAADVAWAEASAAVDAAAEAAGVPVPKPAAPAAAPSRPKWQDGTVVYKPAAAPADNPYLKYVQPAAEPVIIPWERDWGGPTTPLLPFVYIWLIWLVLPPIMALVAALLFRWVYRGFRTG